ncbi:MAG: glycolate oxidase subunit GlcE [Pseudomonadota bacterium]
MSDQDISLQLQEQVQEAARARTPLRIRGGDSKAFFGHPVQGTPLELGEHRGIRAYEPSELVLTARAGTLLTEVEALLAEHGQILPFDPPRFTPDSTLGGAVAAGLSGPGRPWRGSVRDVLLGVTLLDGRGRIMRFGGEVMKNVAGYDLSRLMAGAQGALGILLEVSVRVLPRPRHEATRVIQCSGSEAAGTLGRLRRTAIPLSGACYHDGELHLRLSGAEQAVKAAGDTLPGSWLDDPGTFWSGLRDQRLDFFRAGTAPLWRLSVPPATPPLDAESTLVDWGGAQHWVRDASLTAQRVRDHVEKHQGHAILFRNGDPASDPIFHPLPPAVEGLHHRLKAVFDPQGILNPGRLYPGI